MVWFTSSRSPQPIDGIDAITATASYHRQREIQARGIPTVQTQETDVETTGINLVAVHDLDELGKLSTGVDWYYDDIDSAFGGTASGPIVPDDAYYERIGVFLNWDVALTERLNATAGVRYENIETSGTPIIESMPTPVSANYSDWDSQVGLVYELNPCLHFVGSISEGFRAPNLDDLMANNPNVLQQGMSVPSVGLTPERSTNYEVVLKNQLRPAADADFRLLARHPRQHCLDHRGSQHVRIGQSGLVRAGRRDRR